MNCHPFQARPVYMMLPTDLAYEKIPSYRLRTPINQEPPENDPDVEAFALDEIVKLIEEAKHETIILVDACAIRHGVKKEVAELVRRTGFPVYSAPMGKTSFDEQYERYGGVSRVYRCCNVRADELIFRSTLARSVTPTSRRRLRTRSSSFRSVH